MAPSPPLSCVRVNFIHIHTHTHTHTLTHIQYVYVCVCIHTCVYIYLYMYVCIYIYIYIHLDFSLVLFHLWEHKPFWYFVSWNVSSAFFTCIHFYDGPLKLSAEGSLSFLRSNLCSCANLCKRVLMCVRMCAGLFSPHVHLIFDILALLTHFRNLHMLYKQQ